MNVTRISENTLTTATASLIALAIVFLGWVATRGSSQPVDVSTGQEETTQHEEVKSEEQSVVAADTDSMSVEQLFIHLSYLAGKVAEDYEYMLLEGDTMSLLEECFLLQSTPKNLVVCFAEEV